MNYEDFSPEARKTTDQFLQIAEDIKNGKNSYKITHRVEFVENNNDIFNFIPTSFCGTIWCNFYDFVTGMSAANNCLIENDKINKFLSDKNYFFPTFKLISLQNYFLTIKQYPFIAQ